MMSRRDSNTIVQLQLLPTCDATPDSAKSCGKDTTQRVRVQVRSMRCHTSNLTHDLHWHKINFMPKVCGKDPLPGATAAWNQHTAAMGAPPPPSALSPPEPYRCNISRPGATFRDQVLERDGQKTTIVLVLFT
jgi:hypothetical protein